MDMTRVLQVDGGWNIANQGTSVLENDYCNFWNLLKLLKMSLLNIVWTCQHKATHMPIQNTMPDN